MSLKTGDKAPLFTLPDSAKNMVSLESYRGKNVVLLFFPAAFTGVCTKELANCTDEFAFYKNLNAEIISLSVDMPFSLAKFKELGNYSFPLLSDFNKEVTTAYGVLYKEWIVGLKGVAKRSVFVIDKDGMIRHIEILENAGDFPNFDAVKATLNSLN